MRIPPLLPSAIVLSLAVTSEVVVTPSRSRIVILGVANREVYHQSTSVVYFFLVFEIEMYWRRKNYRDDKKIL